METAIRRLLLVKKLDLVSEQALVKGQVLSKKWLHREWGRERVSVRELERKRDRD